MKIKPILLTPLLLVALAVPTHAHEEQEKVLESHERVLEAVGLLVTQLLGDVARLEQQVVFLNAKETFIAAHEHDHRKPQSCLPRDFVSSQLAEMKTIMEMISEFENENVQNEFRMQGASEAQIEEILNGFREMVIIC